MSWQCEGQPGPFILGGHRFERCPGCADCKPGLPVATAQTLLQVKTEQEADGAFDVIFDLVDAARSSGDTAQCENLLVWARHSDTLPRLHLGVMLPILRLTFTMRTHLPPWGPLLEAAHAEIRRRGEDPDALLCGLHTSPSR